MFFIKQKPHYLIFWGKRCISDLSGASSNKYKAFTQDEVLLFALFLKRKQINDRRAGIHKNEIPALFQANDVMLVNLPPQQRNLHIPFNKINKYVIIAFVCWATMLIAILVK